MEEHELIENFRYLLLSRDRIVTKEDIKALCFTVFGEENIQNVKVSRTVIQEIGKTGLQRAIKIEIKLSNSLKPKKKEIDFNKRELLAQLEYKSVGELPFLVEIIV